MASSMKALAAEPVPLNFAEACKVRHLERFGRCGVRGSRIVDGCGRDEDCSSPTGSRTCSSSSPMPAAAWSRARLLRENRTESNAEHRSIMEQRWYVGDLQISCRVIHRWSALGRPTHAALWIARRPVRADQRFSALS